MIIAQPLNAPDKVMPSYSTHDARSLTDGQTCALIELDGQIYTLRITRSGKLILTK